MSKRITDENLGRIVRVRKPESDCNGKEAFLFFWECSFDVWYENSEEYVWADFNPVAVLIRGELSAMDDGRMGYLCNRRLLAYVADKAAKLEDIPMGEITLPTDEEADEIIAKYGVPTRPLEDYQSRQQEWLDRWDAQGKLGVSMNNYILVKERAIADGFPDVYYNSLVEALRAEKRVEDETAKPSQSKPSVPAKKDAGGGAGGVKPAAGANKSEKVKTIVPQLEAKIAAVKKKLSQNPQEAEKQKLQLLLDQLNKCLLKAGKLG